MLVTVGVTVIAGVALIVAVGLFAASSSTIVSEDFDDREAAFSTDTDNFVALEYAQGGYQVTLKDAKSPQEARTFFDPARTAIRVESDASLLETPSSAAAGLSCYGSATSGYLFLVSNNGRYALVKVIDGTTGDATVLNEGHTDQSLGTTPLRLGLECTGAGSGGTRLSGTVNGTEVASVNDPDGYDQFRAAGYWVGAEDDPTVVLFDNLRIVEP